MISLNEAVFFDSRFIKLHFGFGFPRRRETTGWQGDTLSNYRLRPWRKLVLALRQYAHGGANNKTNPGPSLASRQYPQGGD